MMTDAKSRPFAAAPAFDVRDFATISFLSQPVVEVGVDDALLVQTGVGDLFGLALVEIGLLAVGDADLGFLLGEAVAKEVGDKNPGGGVCAVLEAVLATVAVPFSLISAIPGTPFSQYVQ